MDSRSNAVTLVNAAQELVDARVALFTERATPLGTIVNRVPDSAALASLIKLAADASTTSEVSISRQVADAAPDLIAILHELDIRSDVVQGRDQSLDKAVGISMAFRAIAETGSVLLDERHIQDRAPSLMTIHNLVIVRTSDLISSLDEAPELLRGIATGGPGGYATFVTGPSRSADIEMSLTVGVQGPFQIAMIFVDKLT